MPFILDYFLLVISSCLSTTLLGAKKKIEKRMIIQFFLKVSDALLITCQEEASSNDQKYLCSVIIERQIMILKIILFSLVSNNLWLKYISDTDVSMFC